MRKLSSLSRPCLFLSLSVLLLDASSRGAVLNWSGLGSDGYWSNSGNWGGTTLNYGDTLVFAAGKPRLSNTNNFAGLIVNSIRFTGAAGGYAIYGNSFTLTNSIEATNTAGVNTINPDITLATVNVTMDVASSASLFLDGNLGGSVGLIKTGTGILEFAGNPANTYAGTTWVNTGTLILNRNGFNNAYAGPLVISDGSGPALVQLAQALEMPATTATTINQGGTLDLNNNSDDIGTTLTLNGNGSITTGTGILTLAPNTLLYANPGFFESDTISGNLNVGASGTCTLAVSFDFGGLSIPAAVSGAAAINIISNGYTTFSASNSFTGPLTLRDSSILTINNNYALGSTNAGMSLNNNAALAISAGISVTGKGMTNASANTNGALNFTASSASAFWTGPILLATNMAVSVATNSNIYLEGVVSGSGGLTEIGPGGVVLYGAGNTYTGLTTVMQGGNLYLWTSGTAVAGNLLVRGNVYLIANNQLGLTSDLTIQSTGVFHANGYNGNCNTLNGNGTLDVGTLSMQIGEYSITNCQFDGLITNTGDLYVFNQNVTLTGNNTYTGNTHVYAESLTVNGYQPQSPVDVSGCGYLFGSGTVGNITITNDGIVSPGDVVGILNCASVNLSYPGFMYVYLSGSSPGIGYSQLDTAYATNVNISGAGLYIEPYFNTDDGPTNGQKFVIINNPTVHPIVGTFNGLPNGSIYNGGPGMQFRVGYNEGNNNVVVTYTNPPSQQVSVSVAAGNGNGYLNPNQCNALFVALQNPGTNTMTGVQGTLRSLTPGVSVTQPYSYYSNVPPGGLSTNLTPYQVTIEPWVGCNTPISLQVSFATTGSSTFSIPFSMESGIPLQFDNLTPLPIPDVTTVTSAIPASGLTAPIAKVEVLMNITHSYDNDLVADLIAPDGTTVNLLGHNGQNGQNFGTACGSDFTETIFDDYSLTSIAAGSAPFLGRFKPLSPLSVLNGKSGTNVNNAKWHLRLADTDFGSTGTLQCWSLRIWPGACPDGGGVCELCPNTTLYGILGSSSPTLDRLTRNGVATGCGSPTSCPGPFGESNYYDAYTFRNGPSAACVYVTLRSPGADLFSAAYLGNFTATNVCSNYLADSGDSTLSSITYGGARNYSFNVASNAVFVVVVNGVYGAYGSYALSVIGGSCQPVLNITPAGPNKVALKWTTAAGGYSLESTNRIVGSTAKWQPVPQVPVVSGGQFVVTNTIGSTNQFYRLREPRIY